MITNSTSTIVEGSSSLQTSVANTEIIPSGKRYINFNLSNDQDCNIAINGGSYIFIRANQGIIIDNVFSCKIQQNGITFNWIGTLR